MPPVYLSYGKKYSIPVEILYCVALVESRRSVGYSVIPWPWVLNINGRAHFCDSKKECELELSRALDKTETIAIGLMQILWRSHKSIVKDPFLLLDPHFNLDYGARYLKEQSKKSSSWLEAAGYYHYPAGGHRSLEYQKQVIKTCG